MPLSQIDLDSNIFFEDIETEIEQNLVELRTLYQRLQDLNSDLGYTVMQKEFLNAVERLKLDSYFTWVGQEQAARLTGRIIISSQGFSHYDIFQWMLFMMSIS